MKNRPLPPKQNALAFLGKNYIVNLLSIIIKTSFVIKWNTLNSFIPDKLRKYMAVGKIKLN